MLRVSRHMITDDVPLVEFMYLVFTRTSAESYRRRHASLLLCNLCGVFRALKLPCLLIWHNSSNTLHVALAVHSDLVKKFL